MVRGTTQFYIETRRSDYEKRKHGNVPGRHKEICPKCKRNYKSIESPHCVFCSRKETAIRRRAKRYARMVVERADVKFYFRVREDDELELEEWLWEGVI